MAYQLIFEDRFDQGHVDENVWTFETGGHGFGNKESQFYTPYPNNVDLSQGYLTLIGKKESYQDNAYTSAKITSYPHMLFEYGKLEVEAILPKGHGTWPAIWLLGKNFKEGTKWPLCGEIDLMEHVGHHPNHIHFSLHSQARHFTQGNQLTHEEVIEDVYEKPHVYGMIWRNDHIAFLLDGKEIVSFDKGPHETEIEWPFNQPFYLIFNIALGGSWGGPIHDDHLPTYMHIKRVSYYKEV
jgi:beta-glucanase (GH16 family)